MQRDRTHEFSQFIIIIILLSIIVMQMEVFVCLNTFELNKQLEARCICGEHEKSAFNCIYLQAQLGRFI